MSGGVCAAALAHGRTGAVDEKCMRGKQRQWGKIFDAAALALGCTGMVARTGAADAVAKKAAGRGTRPAAAVVGVWGFRLRKIGCFDGAALRASKQNCRKKPLRGFAVVS